MASTVGGFPANAVISGARYGGVRVSVLTAHRSPALEQDVADTV